MSRIKIPVFVTMALDPAMSDSAKADYSGITVVGQSPERQLFVMEAKRLKVLPDKLVEWIIFYVRKYQPRVLSIEAVQAQRLLNNLVSPQIEKMGLRIPIVDYFPGSRMDKYTRIEETLQPIYKQGRLLIRQGLTDLVQEMDDFPELEHEDLLDSLAQHVTITRPADPFELSPSYVSEEEFDDEYVENPRSGRLDGTWTGPGGRR